VAQASWIPTTSMNFGLLVYKKRQKAKDAGFLSIVLSYDCANPYANICSTSCLPFNNIDEYWAVMYKKESKEILSLRHLLSFG
jgi:hypothetical protein